MESLIIGLIVGFVIGIVLGNWKKIFKTGKKIENDVKSVGGGSPQTKRKE